MQGLFFASAAPPPIGQRVSLMLELMGGRRLRLEGQVAWLRPAIALGIRTASGVGIRFESLSAPDREQIDRLVAERDPLTYV